MRTKDIRAAYDVMVGMLQAAHSEIIRQRPTGTVPKLIILWVLLTLGILPAMGLTGQHWEAIMLWSDAQATALIAVYFAT